MLKTLDIWSDGQFVKFSLASKHICPWQLEVFAYILSH